MLLACTFAVLKPLWKKSFLFQRKNHEAEANIELILSRYGIRPKRYRYSELKRITRSFSENLGEGGYGMVFKGELSDGCLVAVKLLHNSRSDGEEFVNEVVSIMNTSHVNIVCLLGFCLEGSKRGLVYEYMPNGSLERYIYSENPKSALGWEKLYGIAIGVARGLDYLHRGCNRRIIHFDVKPHNILLDENYCPKIADFGLAKLCNIKESIVSMAGARGTIGFIAPEVFSRSFGVVSTKSDIYSFGMVLLEMVGGRRNVQVNANNSSQVYFPEWLHDHLSNGGTLETFEVTSTTEEVATKMALIGLWCIQMMPESRPSITKVIDMLERSVTEIEIPPMQFFSCTSEPSIHSINTTSAEDTQNLSFLSHVNK
ncbi:rust resistance kinase Lr10 [Sorghum bicolor]|jgi:serine/threonine protein kinase|nr:rust resistance kinase Lr10 [Sorghum bicolor]|eukprot:XP_002457414.2 rust resistance kinase Lr10 [Sorghum bicolor]